MHPFLSSERSLFSNFLKKWSTGKHPPPIFPSIIYIISESDFIQIIDDLKRNNNIKKKILFYIRYRTLKDFRFGYGKKIAHNTYLMPEDGITGENGLKIRFYSDSEMIDLLRDKINLKEFNVFSHESQNIQNGVTILDADSIIWGTIN